MQKNKRKTRKNKSLLQILARRRIESQFKNKLKKQYKII